MISEDAVRRELWTSFTSLLRSYVAAAQVGIDPPLVLVAQPSDDLLELVAVTQVVKLTLVRGQAEGYWAIYRLPETGDDVPLAEGAFRLGLDSLMEWTGLPGRQEMDAVAEALATLVLE